MICLVPLTTQDGIALEKIHAACFPDAWSQDVFNRLLAENGVSGWAAQSLKTPPVGFILARAIEAEAEILTFAVLPSSQGLGIGRRLLRELMSFLHPCGCEKIFLEVAVDNKAAIALYVSEGFKVVGTRPNYYQRPGQVFIHALLMTWVRDGAD